MRSTMGRAQPRVQPQVRPTVRSIAQPGEPSMRVLEFTIAAVALAAAAAMFLVR